MQKKTGAQVYTGKDYLRLAKNEAAAKRQFVKLLQEATSEEPVIYVISEKEYLALLPDTAVCVLVTADLEQIKTRFAARMHGILPEPVARMLERKHGCFDEEQHDIHVTSGTDDLDAICDQIKNMLP